MGEGPGDACGYDLGLRCDGCFVVLGGAELNELLSDLPPIPGRWAVLICQLTPYGA